jgi:hypothetical protein
MSGAQRVAKRVNARSPVGKARLIISSCAAARAGYGDVTCTATAYSGIASGYWQYSYNGGPFQYLTGAQVSVSGSGIPYGSYQVQGIGTDAYGNPIAPSNVVTINYSTSTGGGSGGGGTNAQVPGRAKHCSTVRTITALP